jgi:hypothetical protein
MKKHRPSQSGSFNPRPLAAIVLCSIAASLAWLSSASSESNATTAFGGADPTVPGTPRYQNFYAPPGSSAESSIQGEFNIGFVPQTGRILVMNIGPVWRLTPPELLTPAKPECCEALWEDVTPIIISAEPFDPILWTDQKTGRTFAANNFFGANFSYGYTDAAFPFNDGDAWIEAGASPPNGGSDHESIGSGPYPELLRVIGGPGDPNNPVTKGEAVYYCGQTWPLGPAACQRSDDLGASYGPGTLAYTGFSSTGCNSLHGHIHVAPDGTAWLPVRQCAGRQGGAISTDAGDTWTEFVVNGQNDLNGQSFEATSQAVGADPSVAIDANSTAYFCYVNGEGDEGHVHVAVGKRSGSTINWIRDVDVGASHGIVNAAHTEAIGGDAGRAACGFFGTNMPGDYQGGSFTGVWYAFVATTYDEGRTWVTVNATPNDPVQRSTGIWQQGGSGQNGDRNLLDFNEITMDAKGRVLYGYSDGCHSVACINGTPGNRGAYMRVARQFGGKPLLAQFDPTEPAVPKAPCLSGTRNSSGVHLSWKIPDNGGADIIGYRIFRGTSAGTEVFLGQIGPATSFDDVTADPSQPAYYYVRAINVVDLAGGALSNEINFAATPGIWLQSVSSRKSHAGTPYDVPLPLYETGVEDRNNAGSYTLVFTFANSVASFGSVTVTSGIGTIASTAFQNGALVVNLTGVSNAQRLAVTLTNVRDSANNNAASIVSTMGVLIGDTTGDGVVNSADIAQTKTQSGNGLTNTNFREDVTADGNLNSSDIALVKSKSGTGLP